MSVVKKPSFKNEKAHWKNGHKYVISIDEVGRGCFAGPVVASAVIYDLNHKRNREVTDSKKLSKKKSEVLSPFICSNALHWAIGSASVDEINEIGILPATFLAMERALLQLPEQDIVLVDGSIKPLFKNVFPKSVETIIK